MKKKFIVLLYLLIIICTCSIGFATWVFTNDHFFGANYAPQAEFNFNDQKATYDGTVHSIQYPSKEVENEIKNNYGPQIINPITGGSIDSSQNVELYDAGEYNVKFVPLPEKISTYEEINIKYTIDKRTLGFSYGIKENKSGGKRIESTTGKDMVFEFNAGKETYLPDVVPNNLISGDTCTIKYNDMTRPLEIPSNQTYTITECSNSNYQLPSDKTFSVTIKKLKIHLVLVDNVIDVAYDGTPLTWAEAKDLFTSNLKFKIKGDVDTNLVPNPFVLTYDYMHNGYYSYGDKRPTNYATTTNIAGSTYKVKIGTAKSNDYILDDLYFVFKYKTVNVDANKDGTFNDGYMTIEDALVTGGSFKLAGDATSGSSYVITSFSRIDVNDLSVDEGEFTRILKSNNWLHVTFRDSTERYVKGEHTSVGSNVYSTLVIPQGITLNVEKGGQILVCGQVSDNGVTGQRGVLMNNGIINLNGGQLESYGYIKGTGMINALNGTQVSDVLYMYNYPGGRNAAGMKDVIFPMSVYSFHNISCKIKIDGSSAFTAFYRQTASRVKAEGYAAVLGNDVAHGGGKGLFTLTNANQYIIKDVENVKVSGGEAVIDHNFNTSITASNQFASQREILEIHGDFTDNAMKVSVGGQNISTSTSIALPIGYMRIHIMKDGNGAGVNGQLTNNSYKFLPGSVLKVDEGCTITLNPNINVIAYDENYKETFTHMNSGSLVKPEDSNLSYKKFHTDWFTQSDTSLIGSQFIINGTLDAKGGFGGKVKTEVADAVLKIAKQSSSITVLKQITYESYFVTSKVKPTTFSDNPRLRLYNGSEILNVYQAVNTGEYTSTKLANGDSGWFVNGQASIDYDTLNGTTVPSRTINIAKTGYDLVAEDLPQNLTREHYTFGGWYLSTDYRPEYEAKVGTTIFAGTVLHARWIPIDYNINYVHKDTNGNIISTEITNTNSSTFNIETSIGLEVPKEASGLVFGGWYTTETFEKASKINMIQGETLVSLLNGTDTINIYAEWWPKNTNTVNITFDANNPEYDPESYAHRDVVVYVKTYKYALPNLTDNDNNKEKTKYFIGWRVEGDVSNTVIYELNEATFANGNVKLIGVWGDKAKLSIYPKDDNVAFLSVYLSPGQKFTVPDLTKQTIPEGVFDPNGRVYGWLVGGGPNNGAEVHANEVVDLVDNNTKEISLTALYEMKVVFTDDTERKGFINYGEGNKFVSKKGGTLTVYIKKGTTITLGIANGWTTRFIEVTGTLSGVKEKSVQNITGVTASGNTTDTYVVTHDVDIHSWFK